MSDGDSTYEYNLPELQEQLRTVISELKGLGDRVQGLESRENPKEKFYSPSNSPPSAKGKAKSKSDIKGLFGASSTSAGAPSSAPQTGQPSPIVKDDCPGLDPQHIEDPEIQDSFDCIKSSYEKIVLPNALKLHDSRSGIKRDDQTALNILSKSGRYTETALKWLAVAQQKQEDNEPIDLSTLYTILGAHINFLQDEFSALLVKGRFDNSTAQLFRSLQKGNSGFDSRSIGNVRIAAELSSLQKPQSNYRGRGSGYPRGSGFPRGRGRGGDSPYSGFYNKPQYRGPPPPTGGTQPPDP